MDTQTELFEIEKEMIEKNIVSNLNNDSKIGMNSNEIFSSFHQQNQSHPSDNITVALQRIYTDVQKLGKQK